MFIPVHFKRVQDSKVFKGIDITHEDARKCTIESDDGVKDIVTWVSDMFFVSGQTGHTFRPFGWDIQTIR